MYDLVIIGGGAAGLAAAAFAANTRTLVLERLKSPGRKLLVTGGGRCNITHAAMPDDVMARFGKHGRFAAPALALFPPDEIREFFRARGVETIVEPDGCVFPKSGNAHDILNVLTRTKIRTDATVAKILTTEDGTEVTGVQLADGTTLSARNVILAAGGNCRPALGSNGSGFAMARALGLNVTPLVPALGAIDVPEPWMHALAGVCCENANVRILAKGADKHGTNGALLFTHHGISGPAVIDIAADVAALLAKHPDGVPLQIAFDRTLPRQRLEQILSDWRTRRGTAHIKNLLAEIFPKSLAHALAGISGIDDTTTAATLPKAAAQKLVEHCTAFKTIATGTDTFERAMVTRGGIDVRELDPATLECKRIKGLYCVGEVVDIDGPCGGYNLTWALASGRLAATAITNA